MQLKQASPITTIEALDGQGRPCQGSLARAAWGVAYLSVLIDTINIYQQVAGCYLRG